MSGARKRPSEKERLTLRISTRLLCGAILCGLACISIGCENMVVVPSDCVPVKITDRRELQVIALKEDLSDIEVREQSLNGWYALSPAAFRELYRLAKGGEGPTE